MVFLKINSFDIFLYSIRFGGWTGATRAGQRPLLVLIDDIIIIIIIGVGFCFVWGIIPMDHMTRAGRTEGSQHRLKTNFVFFFGANDFKSISHFILYKKFITIVRVRYFRVRVYISFDKIIFFLFLVFVFSKTFTKPPPPPHTHFYRKVFFVDVTGSYFLINQTQMTSYNNLYTYTLHTII
jgi:hypothetical protein